MKHIIFIIAIFNVGISFSQIEKDTITINFDDIDNKTDTLYNLKTKFVERTIKINKQNKIPLEGFYEVITGENSYFVTKYRNGLSDDQIFNYKKHYYQGSLSSIDIKGNAIIGSKYISVPKFTRNKYIKGNYVDASNNIIEVIRIKQKFRKKKVIWKIIHKDGSIRLIKLNRQIFIDYN